MNGRVGLAGAAIAVLLSGLGWAESPAITAEGAGFAVKALEEGAAAYANRDYVWHGVPERFTGWQFTQKGGGERAYIVFAAPEDGPCWSKGRRVSLRANRRKSRWNHAAKRSLRVISSSVSLPLPLIR